STDPTILFVLLSVHRVFLLCRKVKAGLSHRRATACPSSATCLMAFRGGCPSLASFISSEKYITVSWGKPPPAPPPPLSHPRLWFNRPSPWVRSFLTAR